jgi:glucosamine-6-phosphate deaminase
MAAFFLSLFSLTPNLNSSEVLIFDDPSSLGNECARRVIHLIEENRQQNKKTILGLATGTTPLPFYEALITFTKEEQIDWSDVITFNLDEYVGLPKNHPQSYRAFMHHYFFDALAYPANPLGIQPENIHFLNGMAKTEQDLTADELAVLNDSFADRPPRQNLSPQEELWILQRRAVAYEHLLQALGPIDLQILGIGTNGHIGFAEPGSSLSGATMIVSLSENTRRDNARFFDYKVDEVPTQALTMGIGTILKSRHIVLMANGRHKAEIIATVLNEPPNEAVPGTALHLHPNVSFFFDQEAAAGLHTWKQ